MEKRTTRRTFVGSAVTAVLGAAALGAGLRGAQAAAAELREGVKASQIDVTNGADGNDAAQTAKRTVSFLRSRQDGNTGSFEVAPAGDKGAVKPDGVSGGGGAPVFPAITGLVLSGLLSTKSYTGVTEDDLIVAGAVKYILGMQQPDGGIYDKLLPSYNTAICLTSLCALKSSPLVDDAKARALAFLRTLQNGEDAVVRETESAAVVDSKNPFYGGVGYGRHGRPDLSNTAFFVEALHAAGVDGTDPAMKRAVTFLQRVQMLESTQSVDGVKAAVNDQAYAIGSRQGGFIYATGENKSSPAVGQSFAGLSDETLSDGTTASRLRSYGSMTYAGFKSYLYAGLKKSDPRVLAAREWIGKNYTLEENPRLGTDGLYYYYITFSKALAAWGEDEIETVSAAGERVRHLWRKDLASKLSSLQQADGSFKVVDDRWMENNPILIASYALCALGSAVKA